MMNIVIIYLWCILDGIDGKVGIMERYTMVKSTSEIMDIPKEFKNYFGVDLDCEEFKRHSTIEEKWNAIIDATGMGKNIVGGNYIDEVTLQGTDKIFNEYQMYELDVWLNAYFSLKYLEPCKVDYFGNDREIYIDIEDTTKHKLPIRGADIFTEFCKEYKRVFFENKRKSIFNPLRIYENNCNNSLAEKTDKLLRLRKNASLTMFSYEQISKYEHCSKFEIEDKILLYKTLDCNLAKYLTAYYHYEKIKEEEKEMEYISLIQMVHEKKVSEIESFSWKNMYMQSKIHALTVNPLPCRQLDIEQANQLTNEVEAYLAFSQRIISNARMINERLRILTRGLIYCLQSCTVEEYSCLLNGIVRANAESSIEELMNVEENIMALFPKQRNKVFRLDNAEEKILKSYALIQARLIFYKFYT